MWFVRVSQPLTSMLRSLTRLGSWQSLLLTPTLSTHSTYDPQISQFFFESIQVDFPVFLFQQNLLFMTIQQLCQIQINIDEISSGCEIVLRMIFRDKEVLRNVLFEKNNFVQSKPLNTKEIFYHLIYLSNMKKVICLAATLFILSAFAIQVENQESFKGKLDLSVNKPVKINRNSLKGFRHDNIGATFGDSQLRSVLNFIRNATSLYPSSTSKRVMYIKNNMDASFGDSNHQYSVVMESYSIMFKYGDATFYCENGTNFAFLGYASYFQDSWTYLIYKLVYPSISYRYIEDSYEDRGSGVTADQQTQIKNMVRTVDAGSCNCSRLEDIKKNLENSIALKWNVVCQSRFDSLLSFVAVFNSTWMMSRLANCSYLIYAIN